MKNYLIEIVKIAEELVFSAITNTRLLEVTGVADKLEDMYINVDSLHSTYKNIFVKVIKNFLGKELYKDISLDDPEKLGTLSEDVDFIKEIDSTIKSIQEKLRKHRDKILSFLKSFKEDTISLKNLEKEVKLDKIPLLFILEDLWRNEEIYDYNGREVTIR